MKRQSVFSALLVSIAMLAAVPLTDAETVLEVYPTGIYPDDAVNVQAALDSVDSPGTVVLKSTGPDGNPAEFNFGSTPGNRVAIKLLRPDITLTGDGWDEALNEPKTKINGGGGAYHFSPTVGGSAMVFAVHAPGVTIRRLKVTTSAATGVYISSANRQASDHPVVVEDNDFSTVIYTVLASYSAAFPVRINNNVLRGIIPVDGQWIGFTLSPINTFPYDEPVEPRDTSGNVVRFPFEITNNKIIKTPGSAAWQTVLLYGWTNDRSADPDPEVGCRVTGTAFQYVHGDNGPVLISGNEIEMTSPNAGEAIVLGHTSAGLNHAVVRENTVSGECLWPFAQASYGHDNLIMTNDFSKAISSAPIFIGAAGTTFSGNILGRITAEGAPALSLYSSGLSTAPIPNPIENCVIMKNDYRLIGPGHPAVVLVSEVDLKAGTGIGNEVKNNLVFESGRFPEDTGGARYQIQILTEEINPATGLPYVHDNLIVGHPASKIKNPGIGWIVPYIMRLIKEDGEGN